MAWLRMAVLAAAVLGASAYNRPETTKDFKSLDVDESGHVDRAEVDAHLDRQFDVRAQRAVCVPGSNPRPPGAPRTPRACCFVRPARLCGGVLAGCRKLTLRRMHRWSFVGRGPGVDGLLRHEQGRAGPQGRVLRLAEEQPTVLGVRRHQRRRVSLPLYPPAAPLLPAAVTLARLVLTVGRAVLQLHRAGRDEDQPRPLPPQPRRHIPQVL
eukprot:COSAG02_NODE_754_length_17578_cov_97.544825_11_plen_211_part_00